MRLPHLCDSNLQGIDLIPGSALQLVDMALLQLQLLERGKRHTPQRRCRRPPHAVGLVIELGEERGEHAAVTADGESSESLSGGPAHAGIAVCVEQLQKTCDDLRIPFFGEFPQRLNCGVTDVGLRVRGPSEERGEHLRVPLLGDLLEGFERGASDAAVLIIEPRHQHGDGRCRTSGSDLTESCARETPDASVGVPSHPLHQRLHDLLVATPRGLPQCAGGRLPHVRVAVLL
mmetsp:Transcript_103514/g.259527  ORF Transcript_103514/g.259527 Transcript_103514/m.259527 type:complete len:232 (+) Transcript_103514:812-1507(+)